MKRTMKTVGVALLLVAVLAVAVILYDRLGADYGGDPIPGVEPDAETEGKSESDTEAEGKGESESEEKSEDEVISERSADTSPAPRSTTGSPSPRKEESSHG